MDLLTKNKARLGVSSVEGVRETLRRDYEKSLGVVQPLVKRLKYTDELIDQVVYALYGLTEDEIKVVEGK